MSRSTSLVWISVASNIDPQRWVPEALGLLAGQFVVQETSPFYQTAAIDRPEQDDYWNGGVRIETSLQPSMIQRILRGIEAACQRERSDDAYAARTLDLDILMTPELLDTDVASRPFLQQILYDLGGQGLAESQLGSRFELPSNLVVAWGPVGNA